MDYSKEYNYVLVGPGASGKSTVYDKQKIKVNKMKNLSDKDPFFSKPVGAFSYCSVNYSLDELINRIKGKPIRVIICNCNKEVLRKRLTDRLYRRIGKYRNDKYYRKAMAIFVDNYRYNYLRLEWLLDVNRIPYETLDTT